MASRRGVSRDSLVEQFQRIHARSLAARSSSAEQVRKEMPADGLEHARRARRPLFTATAVMVQPLVGDFGEDVRYGGHPPAATHAAGGPPRFGLATR